MDEVRGRGRAIFAAVLLVIAGVLNVIYGIAAIGNSHFYTRNAHYVFGSLKAWGWTTLVIGILELLAAGSLFRGGVFGRFFAIGVGVLAAIGALLEVPAYPFLSLAIFALTLWIIHGLAVYGSPSDPVWERTSSGPTLGREPRGPA